MKSLPKKELDNIIKIAKGIASKSEHGTTWIYPCGKKWNIVQTIFRNTEEKAIAVAGLKVLLMTNNSNWFILIHEGWYRKVESMSDYDDNKSVREQGGIEALFITYTERSGKFKRWTFDIKKGKCGKRFLGKPEYFDGDNISKISGGRMVISNW